MESGINYVNDDFFELVDSQLYVVDGTYGSQQTPTEFYVKELSDGGKWYVARDSKNINFTYDSINDGVDIETLSDTDTITSSTPIQYANDLDEIIISHYGDLLEERGDDYYAKGGELHGEVSVEDLDSDRVRSLMKNHNVKITSREIIEREGGGFGQSADIDYVSLSGNEKDLIIVGRELDLVDEEGNAYAKGGMTADDRDGMVVAIDNWLDKNNFKYHELTHENYWRYWVKGLKDINRDKFYQMLDEAYQEYPQADGSDEQLNYFENLFSDQLQDRGYKIYLEVYDNGFAKGWKI